MESQSRIITGVKTYNAIGMVELSSIAKGMQVTDFMLKSANVGLLMAKTVCPGKYVVMVGGDVAAVTQAINTGEQQGGTLLVDSFLLANVHPDVLPAISGVTDMPDKQAVGIVETFSVAACIEAADCAVKTANITLIRLHMAYGIGGKCYVVMSGDVADVTTATQSASESAGEKGALVYSMVVPNPHPEFWQQLMS